MSKHSSSTSIVEYVKRRKIMRSQQVDVEFQNSLVITDAVLDAVKLHRWNGHRQVRKILRYHLSNGHDYEIFWKTFQMTLPQLLPPNGYAYTLVAEFLLNEQHLHDERVGTVSDSSGSGSSGSGSSGSGSADSSTEAEAGHGQAAED